MKPQVDYLSASVSRGAISDGISNRLHSITIIISHEDSDEWEWVTVHRVRQMEFDVNGRITCFETAHRRYKMIPRKTANEAT